MSFFLRLFGLVVLLPSLAHAATLGIPGKGAKLSGVGVISGWKCEAEGDLTVVFNDDGKHIPLLYGTERTDVREAGACGEANVGFVAIWNWGNLGDGEHTAVAYDNGVEFDRSTFTVTTTGVDFLEGASKELTVEDFPYPGDTIVLEWNQSTQHFEIVDFMGSEPIDLGGEPIDLGECVEGLTLAPEETCTGSVIGIDFTISIDEAGQACIDTDGEVPGVDRCYPDVASFPETFAAFGIAATKHSDGSWTIDSLPA